ncbi:MAG TPA: polysaccharide deacetylase family protein [Thermoanaerobaculia bacterium]|nr:polysaccharide deacetylase family protein [Thermoanaerobaculia bacterium]
MNRLLPLLFAIALGAPTLPLSAQGTPPGVTILCYHEVEPEDAPSHATIPRNNATESSTAEQKRYVASITSFRQQLDYLKTEGFNVISLSDLYAFLTGELQTLPDKSVVVTVDDGWLCARTHIYPEMKKRGLPWTLFIYPKTISRGTHSLTWKQVAELSANGVDVQSHSFTHPFLSRAKHPEMSDSEYATWLENELLGSKKRIEKETGKSVRFLCYPFGDHDDGVAAAAKTCGYVAALTTVRGVNDWTSELMHLKRQLIHNTTTLEQFAGWLNPAPSKFPQTIVVPFGTPHD